MSEQENAGPLDFRKRGHVTAAELLQMLLLLWRELDGILGQRSWHKDSPPDQAQVSRMVIGQDLAPVKPTMYLLRTVLSGVEMIGHKARLLKGKAQVMEQRTHIMPIVEHAKLAPDQHPDED
jgi:hypothetical protein